MTKETMSSKANMGQPRQMPLLSQVIFLPVQLLLSSVYLVSSTLMPSMVPNISMFIGSGFLGFMPLVPVIFWWICGVVLDTLGVCSSSTFWRFVVAPFCAIYFVNIIILDRTHLQVKNSGMNEPTNLLGRVFTKSFWAFHDYNADVVTCTPWVKDAKLPTDENHPPYVFGCHPHGIHCTSQIEVGSPNNSVARAFPNLSGPKLTGLAATVLFKTPVVREMFLYMGYIDASRRVVSKALAEGQSIYVCVGGEEEVMLTEPGKEILVLKKRKGFVRVALSQGATLVPILGIGTNDVFKTYSFLMPLRKWMQKSMGVALPIFHGRFFTPLPLKNPIHIVVGEPIPTPTPKVPGGLPEKELVDEYHSKYVDAIRQLHAKHAPKERELIIL